MNRILVALTCLSASLTPVSSSAKDRQNSISGLELQQIQSHDFESEKKLTFSSVMSVLQDAGYRIQAADLETGIITGVASSKGKMNYNLFWGFGKSKLTPIVSSYIEEISPQLTRVRLNFVMAKVKSTIYGSQPQDEEPITDPKTYQDAFEKIAQAVFVRQSMADTAPTAGSTSPPTH